MVDPHNLQRFVDAQSAIYQDVIGELIGGRKQTHWMWFVFPQLTGLGRTAAAHRYGIASVDEARAYLAHPVLGPRLRECAGLLRDHVGERPIELILGSLDALKLRSSMTLFRRASTDTADRDLFDSVLTRYYDGEPDPLTCSMLSAG